MKELVVLSGKGGTGKTSMVGALATMATNMVLVDCDVDAANLHLIVDPTIKHEATFTGGKVAVIDQDRCTACGTCPEYCRFDAIINMATDRDAPGKYRVDPLHCEGCAACSHFCPEEAISMIDTVSGRWFVSDCRFGPFVHGELGIGQSNSGRLVALLREQARKLAHETKKDLILIDGPPGIGCPVIASLTGTHYVLMVTEPSLTAFHDLKRLLALTKHFKIPCGIAINKADINPDVTEQIRDYATGEGNRILGRIPFDPAVTKAQAAGTTLVDYANDALTASVRDLWRNLDNELNSERDNRPKTA